MFIHDILNTMRAGFVGQRTRNIDVLEDLNSVENSLVYYLKIDHPIIYYN